MDIISSLGIPILVVGLVSAWLLFTYIPVRLWIAAWAAGVRISLWALVGMRLRKVPPRVVVEPQINATKAGLHLDVAELEAHYLAGGQVNRVVQALISADKAGIELHFQQAAAIDLAGRDVQEAVQVLVNPKVIDTPKVAAMAKDGIQLIATARVTVRANIQRLVGGAGEETILARVGEGIVSTIGSSEGHQDVAGPHADAAGGTPGPDVDDDRLGLDRHFVPLPERSTPGSPGKRSRPGIWPPGMLR